MMTQLLLSALFLACGLLVIATLASSVRRALPQLRSLRAEMASGDPQREITWRIVSVEVKRRAAAVSVLPIRPKVALPRQQAWLAAA